MTGDLQQAKGGLHEPSSQSLQQQNDRLQLLLNLTNRITSNLELGEVLRAVSANIRELMQCDAVGFLLYDKELGKFRLLGPDFPHGKGVVREGQLVTSDKNDPGTRALQTLTPVVVTYAEQEVSREMRELAKAQGVKTSCFIPLVNRGRALGVLGISRTTDGSFSNDDIAFLSQASGQIAIAVENALAYSEISALKDRLAQEKLYLEEEIRSGMNFDQIVGNRSVRDMSPVLRSTDLSLWNRYVAEEQQQKNYRRRRVYNARLTKHLQLPPAEQRVDSNGNDDGLMQRKRFAQLGSFCPGAIQEEYRRSS